MVDFLELTTVDRTKHFVNVHRIVQVEVFVASDGKQGVTIHLSNGTFIDFLDEDSESKIQDYIDTRLYDFRL